MSPPVDGVLATCTARLTGGGRLVVSLIVTDRSQAAILVALPLLQRTAALDLDQLRELERTSASAPDRVLMPLPGAAPVALAPVSVSGVSSAVLVVSCTGCTRRQVEAVASLLL